MAELFDSYLEHAIGGTPLVPLKNISSPSSGQVWVKLESGIPLAAIRTGWPTLYFKNAFARGDITTGSRLVEYTGGSTGTSLAHIASRTGIQFIAVSSDAFAQSKIDSMLAYGAEGDHYSK